MIEPNWDLQPEKFKRACRRDDIVWVRKKTRGRFGNLEVARPGDHGIVISTWTSNMGSKKVCILTSDMREVSTTESCLGICATLDDLPEWREHKYRWMTETYIPIIIIREPATRKRRNVHPFVSSRDGNSVLVKPLASEDRIWLSKEKMHPVDWEDMISSDVKCLSVRVPAWLAKKAGLLGVCNGK